MQLECMTGSGRERVAKSRYRSRFWTAPLTMPFEAARDLSIPDLLRVLSEKLNQECSRLQENPLPPVVTPAFEVESEVRPLSFNCLSHCTWNLTTDSLD